MKRNPLVTPADREARVDLLRNLTRWAVSHWGVVTILWVLLVVGAWVAAWWLGLQQGLRGDDGVAPGLVTFRLFDTAGWVCLAGAGCWLLLWFLFCAEAEPFLSGRPLWHFAVRQRQRIFEGRPIEPGLLGFYGWFGVSGLVLGLALGLKLTAAIGWQDPAITKGDAVSLVLGPGFLALAVFLLSGRLIRDVLFLRDFDYFVGDKAREYAESVIEKEERKAEAEREQERKDIGGWAFLVLIGGFYGGMLLSSRFLPEPDASAAAQGSVSGLILSAAGLYLLKTRPRLWRLWLALVIVVAIGFLVFIRLSWGGSLLCLFLGVLWGAAVGTAGMVLHLRQLKADER